MILDLSTEIPSVEKNSLRKLYVSGTCKVKCFNFTNIFVIHIQQTFDLRPYVSHFTYSHS